MSLEGAKLQSSKLVRTGHNKRLGSTNNLQMGHGHGHMTHF